ncbi:sigma-70 family RNA polymerase sigma factor [Paenibacillus sp. PsM32]|uniref:sigma-70 family RNA polymerase sigma factor n=1 Tax=Paenibacillus sp. PsM32 TaxID=3030536 RepID=UPI00263A4FC3|nr:sigma-70 family RNA polymerase sigma factor [Paenibacillus sp. PsM32]MDN4619780.1 sigma-70 family RNA polymerase sigma factor [Paenibacillus sp. PsM32]
MTLKKQYQEELKRLAWRIHYRIKKTERNEKLVRFDPIIAVNSFEENINFKLSLEQMLNELSSLLGKEIIYRIYILEEREKDVAYSLNMTQQAVNRWKQKMLKEMRTKMSIF